jgi:6,7-dimethyl-8-ribityllumazine synthase
MSIDYIPPDLEGNGLRIGIVQARFNEWAGSRAPRSSTPW